MTQRRFLKELNHRAIASAGAAAIFLVIGASASVGKIALAAEGAANSSSAQKKTAPATQIASYSFAKDACTQSESWTYGSGISDRWRWEMDSSLKGKTSPARGFSEALALRKLALSTEGKILAEYFISRSLFRANLVHIAYNGFVAIASRPLTDQTAGIQIAALECINKIQRKYPSFELPDRVPLLLKSYLSASTTRAGKNIVYEFTENWIRNEVGRGKPERELRATLQILKGSGPFEALAELNLSARRSDYKKMAESAERFLNAQSLPNELKRFKNYVHLMAARAYFSLGKFTSAQNHYKLVEKSSNQLTEVLSELSWAYLMEGKYREAIGTTLNLHQGAFINTFSPEAPMVMAMAMNELCQYPDSLRSINLFKKNYEKPYLWLSSWHRKSGAAKNDLYSTTIAFIQKKKIDVPTRVASEWIRSPTFISHQDEINLLFEEEEATARLGREAAQEQREMGAAILKFSNTLQRDMQRAKARMKPGDEFPSSIKRDLSRLREVIRHYQRFRRAAPVWQVILANFQKQIKPREQKLVAAINKEIQERNTRMLLQVQEVAENNQLIEVEIYNGATQDIIWQNAHPDYKEIAKSIKDNSRKKAASMVYDWGRMPASSDEEVGEVWEDELGSFKADVFDNCSNKEKYLAIKRSQIRERLNQAN